MKCQVCSKDLSAESFFCHWCGSYVVNPASGTKASLFRRAVALCLDPLLMVIGIILTIMGFERGAVPGTEGARTLMVPAILLCFIVYPIFFLVMLSKGFTPGKYLLGLRVVDAQSGSTPGFVKMFIREVFGRFLSGLFFGIGYFWAIFDKSGQCWHDKLAGTVVLHEKKTATNSSSIEIKRAA